MENNSRSIDGYIANSTSVISNLWHKCVICGKTYGKRKNLMRHIRGTHDHVRYICKICNSEYKRKDYLIKHEKSCHPTSTQPPMPKDSESLYHTSVACQTKKCRLHKSKLLTHTSTGPDRPTLSDQCTTTDDNPQKVTFQDRGCSPVMWGNISTPTAQPPVSPLMEYHTRSVESQSSCQAPVPIPDLGDVSHLLSHTTEIPSLEGPVLSLEVKKNDFFVNLDSLDLDFSIFQ